MSRIRLVLVSGFAVLAFTALSAASASAIKFEWSVNGTPLAAGVLLTVSIRYDGTVTLTGTVFGASTELLSSASTTTGAKISGGKPGTGEGATTFEKVTVDKPKNCAVAKEEVITNNVESTIVEGATGGVGNGTALILLRPKTSSIFAHYEYIGEKCSLNGDEVKVAGSVLLDPLSSTSQELQLWTFEPSGHQSISSTGTLSTNNLTLNNGTSPASISGNVEALLVDDQPFSAL